jgi:Flp pilus assembly protein TadD
LDEAFEQFSIAAQHNPGDFISKSQMGCICAQKKDFVGAIQHFQAALALNPGCIEALNNLAWIRAANASADFRNGPEAVELARRACVATQSNEPVVLGTLAAAYAEAGDFTNAIATATQARELAASKNQKTAADRNEMLLELYRAGRAYHEGEGDAH